MHDECAMAYEINTYEIKQMDNSKKLRINAFLNDLSPPSCVIDMILAHKI